MLFLYIFFVVWIEEKKKRGENKNSKNSRDSRSGKSPKYKSSRRHESFLLTPKKISKLILFFPSICPLKKTKKLGTINQSTQEGRRK